jgi:hypothetical protein
MIAGNYLNILIDLSKQRGVVINGPCILILREYELLQRCRQRQFLDKRRKSMKWKSRQPTAHEEYRVERRFCFLPYKAPDGNTYWMRTVIVVSWCNPNNSSEYDRPVNGSYSVFEDIAVVKIIPWGVNGRKKRYLL